MAPVSGMRATRSLAVKRIDTRQETTMDAKQWLHDWIDENLQVPHYFKDKSEMADDAATCRAAAEVDGISPTDLNKAVGGDLEKYLLAAQNKFTETALRRQKER